MASFELHRHDFLRVDIEQLLWLSLLLKLLRIDFSIIYIVLHLLTLLYTFTCGYRVQVVINVECSSTDQSRRARPF
ncbi:hypothetical protein BJX66DRAFT_300162 [Aspergillus keveii]|uniref:Uncharacterized protein n=1 Tax=Aspergillus keveii TaxID=714993 RepID=A0ABR4GBX3_9EURO